jgi:hypothetical protein
LELAADLLSEIITKTRIINNKNISMWCFNVNKYKINITSGDIFTLYTRVLERLTFYII